MFISSDKNPIYLDYASTTPVDPRVFDYMKDFFCTNYGNPDSQHLFGWASGKEVENAREIIANVLNASSPSEIIFTSGATESNNLAIKGGSLFCKENRKTHVISVVTEHKCVINSIKYLSNNGFDITFLPVNSSGIVDLESLKNSIRDETALVSIMAVNNETGIIQPLEEIGKICDERGVIFHTDAAQAFGKIEIDVERMNIGLLSISGHKIYGPKGIGALYVRKKNKRVRLHSIISGGGQERGLRSGTLPVPLIAGLGKAAEIYSYERESEFCKIKKLHDFFVEKIFSNLKDVHLNGDKNNKVPNIVNISFDGVEGESVLMSIRNSAFSSGSACNSKILEPSHVIKAMNKSDYRAHTALRFSFGRQTSFDELNIFSEALIDAINKLRAISPIY